MIYIMSQEGLYQYNVTLSLAFIHNCKMAYWYYELEPKSGVDLEEGTGGAHPSPEMTCGFLIQQVFSDQEPMYSAKKTLWFIGIEFKHETRLKNFSVKRRKNGS